MTTKIYSKLDPSKLLHMIVRDIPEGRTNLCAETEFLQCASLRLPKGTTFKPHTHRENYDQGLRRAQESWIVIKGVVKVVFYDTDGSFLCNDVICAGELSLSFSGGHNYEILTEGCKVFEYKTGPYISQEHDKIFIDESNCINQ